MEGKEGGYNYPMEQPDIFSLLPEKETVMSVAQFLDMVNDLLQPLSLTVRGEVSSVQERPSGTYFSISDTEEQAKLDCVLWKRNSEYYRSIIKVGAEVQIAGSPNIYKPFGKLSFIASHITPVGEGALQAAFEALKRQLEKEGYFAQDRKRQIPLFVEKIGLVTSEFGDAKKDFVTHLGNYGFKIQFHDARVEGVNAIPSIIKAIDWFNTNVTDIDVLVITRGGGSLESLQAFNSLEVAQAIFSSRIPVISAIGHENDVSISDMVADVRASTPTHAGKIISQNWMMAEERVDTIDREVTGSFQSSARRLQHQYEQIQLRMFNSFTHALQHKKNSLTMASNGMISNFKSIFTRFERLEQSIANKSALMQQQANSSLQLLQTMEQKVFTTFSMQLKQQDQKLSTFQQLIDSADPAKRLKQGYSMTFTKDGQLVKDIKQLRLDDTIKTNVANGSVFSKVTKDI